MKCFGLFMFMTGFAYLGKDIFPSISEYWWMFAILGSVLGIGFYLLYASKMESFVFFASIGIACVGMAASMLYFRDGIFVLTNDIFTFLTGKTARVYLDYPVENQKNVYFVFAWLCFLVALWMAKAVRNGEKKILLAVLLLLVIAIATGFAKAGLGFFCVFLAMVCFFFVNRGTPPMWAILVCFLVCSMFFGIEDEFSNGQVTTLVMQQLHKWKYEKKEGAMPEGNLSNLGAFQKEKTIDLEVEMGQPQNLYLRGMVGEIYTGTSWEELPEDTYIEAEDTFYWLHKMGFYGQSSIGRVMELTGETNTDKMTIRNVSACKKYAYLPYALKGKDNLEDAAIGDGSVTPRKDTLTVTYVPGSVPAWYQGKINLVNQQEQEMVVEYLKQERTYREFVYKQDLQLTNEAVGVCQRLLSDVDENMTLPEITDLIRVVLANELEYSEEIVTNNENNDFMQYTLEQTKTGYSVHYATIATLMFRYCGVPARYVEGYYLSKNEAAAYEVGQTIVLGSANQHAWAEYYLDGIGWIPFEVTPGYMDYEELGALYTMTTTSEQGEMGSRSYQKSGLIYRPALDTQTGKKNEERKPFFYINWKVILMVLLACILVAITASVHRLVVRYKHLGNMFQDIQKADHAMAISLLYSYAMMLKCYGDDEACKSEEMDEYHCKMKSLNEEAMFSGHKMTKEQRKEMILYAREVLNLCKKKWSIWQKFYYRYIIYIYR